MRLMGIDYGDARVGIALSDPLMIMSQGYKTIQNDGTDALFCEIVEIIKEKEVTKIVIGLPKNMDNSQGFRTDATMEFAEKLKTFTDVEIDFSDERLTTVEATNYMLDADISRKKRKEKIDSLAANIILQTYLDKEKRG